jgi:integrase
MPLTLVPPRKGKSPNYRIRGTIRSRYLDETTGTSDRDIAEAIRIKRESQLLNESVFGARASRTFAEAAVGYVEAIAPTGTQREAVIGRIRRDGSLGPCLVADFGDRLVNTIDQEAVDLVIRKRFVGRKPNTIERNLITPLTAVLTWAAKRKWCDMPRFERPKYDDRRRRWATREEANRLLEGASPHIRPLLLFLILSGARIGEAVNLEWTNVDLNARWMVFRDTKNGEDRGVPIHQHLVTALANLPGEREGPVFRTHRGQQYGDRDAYGGGGQIKTAWRTACRRGGIVDLHPHDLRHSFSTWLTMAGTHEQVRDEIMGHESTHMGRRYAHIPREALLQAIDKLHFTARVKSADPAAEESKTA